MPTLVTYPPPMRSDVEEIARRVKAGDRLKVEEKAWLTQLSPIVQGEFLITAHQGRVTVKRYVGVDSSEI